MIASESPHLAPTGPNAEQIRYWNELAGPTWARFHLEIEAQLHPFGIAAMDRAGLRPGARVLDVGCGAGETSFELARRVGPTGHVTGVDLSGPMLEIARAHAESAGVTNVRFEHVDASTAPLPEQAFDVVFSRFGVMFFADPKAAFTHLHARLAPAAKLAFACWRGAEANPWMVVPLMAVAGHVEIKIGDPTAPGPLAFADEERVRGILEGAGFRDVVFEAMNHRMHVGGASSLDDACEFLTHIGPAARAMREAAPEKAAAAKVAMRAAVTPYHGADGLRLGGGVWLVTATR